jgi:hypothetical protein
MDSQHVLFELRTGRDAEHTPETAVQLLATLPTLKDTLWDKLLGRHEHLSFELIVEQQMAYFYCYVPLRVSEYIRSSLAASYPEALITPITVDPVETTAAYQAVKWPTALGSVVLKNQEFFALRTYQDFKDVDPATTLLSALAKSGPDDRVVLQFVLKQDTENWKYKAQSLLAGETAHPQKALIEKKLGSRSLKVGIQMAVVSSTQERATLLLETIASSLSGVSLSEGNSLVLRKMFLGKSWFMNSMVKRQIAWPLVWPYHLSLEEIATLYHLPNNKLAGIPNIAWGKHLLGEPPENLPIITKDSPPEIKKEINPFARVEYKNAQAIYGIKRADRRRHLYVIGKTGTGKSTLLANMAINDLKNDEGLCVIDPHGDLVETLLNYIPSRRINDVVYFDPADPERTVKINLFEGKNVEHRELIASGIVAVFQKLYAYSWGPRLEYILRNALLTLLKSPQARMSDILDLLTNEKFREKIVEKLEDPILKNFWVYEYDKMPDRQRTDAIAPILNKVGQFVSSPLVRDVVNAHKSSFDLEDIMNQGKILLVNLSQGRLGEDNATLLGAMLITKIQLSAMARVNTSEENRRDFFLYVDEFQNFATTSFIKILSEARKYRLNLTLANQYIAQIPEDVQKAIFGNCGSMASFVMGADDAGAFEKEFGGKYDHEDLVTLSRYQIINKLSIDNIVSLPFPAQTLPLAKSSNQNRDKVMKVSRERYATKK